MGLPPLYFGSKEGCRHMQILLLIIDCSIIELHPIKKIMSYLIMDVRYKNFLLVLQVVKIISSVLNFFSILSHIEFDQSQ